MRAAMAVINNLEIIYDFKRILLAATAIINRYRCGAGDDCGRHLLVKSGRDKR